MKKRLFFLLFLLPVLIQAQRNDFRSDSISISKISLHITPDLSTKTIRGEAILFIRAKLNNVVRIRLDLLRMQIMKLECPNLTSTYFYNDSLIFLNFGTALIKDSIYQLTIVYQGTPMQDASAWGGWYWNGNYAFNLGVGFKSIPHNLGRAWFPCIDNFKSKQAFDISISCPQNLKAISNGVLISQIDTGIYSTYSYHLPQPIPAYLASCNIGPYTLLMDSFTSIDQRKLYTRIACEAKDTQKVALSFQKLKATISHFETLFGPYPFEVAGYSLVPFNSGAMEHATNIAYPIYAADGSFNYETLWAHELSHMWWGDNITCASAEEMWINEGWASYCERLFTEHFYGEAAYHQSIDNNHRYCLQFAHLKDSGYYALDNVPQAFTYGVHSYQKGCDMIHGLRFLDTALFFAGCRKLHAERRFTAISTDTLLSYFGSAVSRTPNLYFKNKDYVSNKLESTKITINNPTSTDYHTKIATYSIYPYLGYKFPIRIDYLDSLNQRQQIVSDYASPGGYYNFAYLTHPNFRVFFDMQNLIPDANTSQYYWIKNSGSVNYDNEICNVVVSQVTDSAMLYINRSWDFTNGSSTKTGIQANTRGFWTVDGLQLQKLKGSIRFHYQGGAPISFSGLESVDYGFITKSEDSLVLLYREKYLDDWQVVNTAVKSAGTLTDKKGSFLVNEIRRGQYCIGQYNYQKTGLANTNTESTIKVYPNPSKGLLNVDFELGEGGGMMELIDLHGQIIFNQQLNEEKNTVSTTSIAKGIYVLRVQNAEQVFYKKIIID